MKWRVPTPYRGTSPPPLRRALSSSPSQRTCLRGTPGGAQGNEGHTGGVGSIGMVGLETEDIGEGWCSERDNEGGMTYRK